MVVINKLPLLNIDGKIGVYNTVEPWDISMLNDAAF